MTRLDGENFFLIHGATLDYFADFFKAQTGEILNDDYRAAMQNLLTELARAEREA